MELTFNTKCNLCCVNVDADAAISNWPLIKLYVIVEIVATSCQLLFYQIQIWCVLFIAYSFFAFSATQLTNRNQDFFISEHVQPRLPNVKDLNKAVYIKELRNPT